MNLLAINFKIMSVPFFSKNKEIENVFEIEMM